MTSIARLIEPEVKRLGYELVRVMMIGGTSDPTLQVMAERPDTRQLNLTDCEQLSRGLSELLDRDDPIEGSYRLEVSSPGIDRPLTRQADYADWTGHEARITLAEPRARALTRSQPLLADLPLHAYIARLSSTSSDA